MDRTNLGWVWCIAALLAMTSPGCKSSPTDQSDGGGGTEDGGVEETWSWKACPLYVGDPWGRTAECAEIPVPLHWDDPDGPTLNIFVKRLLASGDSQGQLWLLQGGPGGSGQDFAAIQELIDAADGTWDTYAIDHRGVGRSSRLGCPAEAAESEEGFLLTEAEMPQCLAALQAEWGADLDAFTTTAAARDLEFVIEETRAPTEKVFVYGASYGTTWAHRYLQINPSQADGVILDSLAINIYFTDFDLFFDQVGEDYLARCALDATCSGKMGTDVWGAIWAALESADAGHCPELGVDRMNLRRSLGLMLQDRVMRDLIPAIVYRYQRCDAADVAAITHLANLVTPAEVTPARELFSQLLYFNIALSDFWPDPAPTLAELQAIADATHIGPGSGPLLSNVRETWPIYSTDTYWQQWAQTDIPILMLNGDMDPQTPIWVATPAQTYFDQPHHYFVTAPDAPHGIMVQTPIPTSNVPCGMSLVLDFLADPLQPPDTTCMSSLIPSDFTGNPAWATYLLGASDYWENLTPFAPTEPEAPPGFELARPFARTGPGSHLPIQLNSK